MDIKLMGSERVKCVNLCPAEPGLSVVGRPRKVAPAGMEAVLRFEAPEGARLLCADSSGRLRLYDADGEPVGEFFGPVASGKPLCAEFVGGELLVMYADGLRRYSYPGLELRKGSLPERLPGLRGSDSGYVMVQVAARTVGGDMRTASALEPADARAVEADYRGAVAEMLRQARTMGVYVQPVVARYVLEDEAGNALFTSPAVMVGRAAMQHLMPLRCTASGLLEGYMLQAQSNQLQLSLPPGLAAAGVRRVRVLATPQLHTVLPATSAVDLRVGHNAGTGYVAEVSVGLEPVAEALLPGTAGAVQTVAAVVARMDALEHTVAVLEPTAGSYTIYAGADSDAETEYRTVGAALHKGVAAASAEGVLAAAPHAFVASAVARCGDTLMWGDIAVRRYGGYPLEMLAASTAAKSWHGYTAVEFADGRRRVLEQTQTSGAPTLLQPVLSYPSADAVALTVGLAVNGGQPVERRFPLTPAADGRSALWVAPGMEPFAITDTVATLTVPTDTDCLQRVADCVVAADVRAPEVALASARGFGTKIVRMLPAAGGTAAWDFGRERALVFAAGGIYTAALNAARHTIARGRIDERRTEGAEAVARGTDGDVYAVASGALLRVRSRRTTTLLTGLPADTRTAYDAVRRELWLLGEEAGKARVVCVELKGLPGYRRDADCAAKVLDTTEGAMLSGSGGVADISHQEPATGPVAVDWQSTVELPARFRPAALSVDALGEEADIRISLDDTSVRAAGAVRSPLRMRVPHHAARRVALRVHGEAAADFCLRAITLKSH